MKDLELDGKQSFICAERDARLLKRIEKRSAHQVMYATKGRVAIASFLFTAQVQYKRHNVCPQIIGFSLGAIPYPVQAPQS